MVWAFHVRGLKSNNPTGEAEQPGGSMPFLIFNFIFLSHMHASPSALRPSSSCRLRQR